MCGICGIWGEKNESHLENMKKILHHRGPDADGSYKTKKGMLGHCRLAIIDIENGKQPIYNKNRSMTIVANAEIYNHRKLYKNLSKRYEFSTKSDVEVILHLFEEKGVDVVNFLDGMFAFCISDGNSIFVARDPLGIKPLYYLIDKNGTFYFSSELKSMKNLSGKIREFPPGNWYHSDYGFKRYYEVPDLKPKKLPFSDHIKNLKQTLEKSVVKRLMSDVPVGSFLSGGLDSSIITALAKKHTDSLHTFCVGVKNSKDVQTARQVAEYVGSTHHEYILTENEVIEKIPEIIFDLESFDQDLVRSAIPCYFVSKLASKFVKVILSGEGADELFGGYQYYKQIPNEDLLRKELRRSVNSLHNINLQRLDRMTMAHSIEGRVPFLDIKMIELAQTIPNSLKLVGSPPVEKWILRKAFENILPDEIVWREKQQFDQGSGILDLISKNITQLMSQNQADEYKRDNPSILLRTTEECFYHKIFSEKFPNSKQLLNTVGRWSLRPTLTIKK